MVDSGISCRTFRLFAFFFFFSLSNSVVMNNIVPTSVCRYACTSVG